eukprot:4044517-Karenia_brevis.AAC.1
MAHICTDSNDILSIDANVPFNWRIRAILRSRERDLERRMQDRKSFLKLSLHRCNPLLLWARVR